MSLYLDSIAPKEQVEDIGRGVLADLRAANAVIEARDGHAAHLSKTVTDALTGEALGALSFTLVAKADGKTALTDVDLALSGCTADLTFLQRLSGEDGQSECYHVSVPDGDDGEGEGSHLSVEVVHRLCIDGNILEKTLPAHVSAFPFSLSVYENLDEMNLALGFKPMEIDGKMRAVGLSAHFTAPAGMMGGGDDSSSMLVGTVKAIRDVEAQFDDMRIPFTLLTLDSALGDLPVAARDGVFDLSALRVGSVLVLDAVVKADLYVEEAYDAPENA